MEFISSLEMPEFEQYDFIFKRTLHPLHAFISPLKLLGNFAITTSLFSEPRHLNFRAIMNSKQIQSKFKAK